MFLHCIHWWILVYSALLAFSSSCPVICGSSSPSKRSKPCNEAAHSTWYHRIVYSIIQHAVLLYPARKKSSFPHRFHHSSIQGQQDSGHWPSSCSCIHRAILCWLVERLGLWIVSLVRDRWLDRRDSVRLLHYLRFCILIRASVENPYPITESNPATKTVRMHPSTRWRKLVQGLERQMEERWPILDWPRPSMISKKERDLCHERRQCLQLTILYEHNDWLYGGLFLVTQTYGYIILKL